MGVLSAIRTPDGRSMTVERDGRKKVDTWDVIIDPETGVDSMDMIYDSGMVPRRGDQHPESPSHFCTRAVIDSSTGPIHWRLVAEYSNNQGQVDPDDPTLAPPDWQWSSEANEEEVDLDINGVAITNTAGEPIDPPLTRRFRTRVLSYQANVPETLVNPDWLLSYCDHTNTDQFLGAAPGEVLVDDITAKFHRGTESIVPYYEINAVFKIRRNYTDSTAPPRSAWWKRWVNVGFSKLESGERVTILDANGNPLNRPVLLDALGQPTATPLIKFTKVYAETALKPLGVVLA